MNRLALGTAQFSGLPYGIANLEGQVVRSTVKAMLELAANNGIDTLDTAITYGDSEASLGEAGIQSFKLVTKLPAGMFTKALKFTRAGIQPLTGDAEALMGGFCKIIL